MKPDGVLETVLYAPDIDRAEEFYRDVLGLERLSREGNRDVFFWCGKQLLLIFNPDATEVPPGPDALPIPPHGARGPGHVCFRASAEQIGWWRERLRAHGVAIESEFTWPQGGSSIYFRDPAGNCLEFAEPRIWGL